MTSLDRDVVGTAPLVHLGDGFVELAPACVPGAFRFYRGKAPSVGMPLVTGGTGYLETRAGVSLIARAPVRSAAVAKRASPSTRPTNPAESSC